MGVCVVAIGPTADTAMARYRLVLVDPQDSRVQAVPDALLNGRGRLDVSPTTTPPTYQPTCTFENAGQFS